MSLEVWVYAVLGCLGLILAIWYFTPEVIEDLPYRWSDWRENRHDRMAAAKWRNLMRNGMFGREVLPDHSLGRWILKNPEARRTRDFLWLVERGELKPFDTEGRYFEPSLRITNPAEYQQQKRIDSNRSFNRSWLSELVSKGYVEFVDEHHVRILHRGKEFESIWSFLRRYQVVGQIGENLYYVNYDGTNPVGQGSVSRAGYQEYLRSSLWLDRRQEALERAGYRCQVCNRSDDLQVHHRTYANVGHEEPEDLTVLCAECHQRFHADGNMPVR